ILRRNLRGNAQRPAEVRAHQRAEHSLALPFSVGEGGIEKIDAEIGGELERSHRLVIIRAGPSSESPHPVADLGDGPTETAEGALVHGRSITSTDRGPPAAAPLAR